MKKQEQLARELGMYDVVVVGGGWAGCSAALAAAKQSMKVALLERSDSLLGVGLAGGIFRNQARFTVAEEMIAMGGGELFMAMDDCIKHRNVLVPNHENLCTYDIFKIVPAVGRIMTRNNIDIFFNSLVREVKQLDSRINSVITVDGMVIEGKVFIDATGTAGPEELCRKNGTGCVQCLLRCPTFGPRISLASLTGIEEDAGVMKNGRVGAMSGGGNLFKESLSPELRQQLSEKGYIQVAADALDGFTTGFEIPPKFYLSEEMKKNLLGVDVGVLNFMGRPFIPLHKLQLVKGFENARYCDPASGGIGNSMRYQVCIRTDQYFRVPQKENLYSAGEKVGPWVGKTEAVITGHLAGHNAARKVKGDDPIKLPNETAVGFGLSYVYEITGSGEKYKTYGFSGGSVFEALRSHGLYSSDPATIRQRVDSVGLTGIFN